MTYLKRYPLTCCCIALIFVLCFMPVPDTPLGDVPFIDKWTHVAMYLGTCSVLWFEYLRKHDRLHPLRMLLWGVVAPIVMSGAIEVLQGLSGYRSCDFYDFLANSVGVLLAYGLMKCVCDAMGKKRR